MLKRNPPTCYALYQGGSGGRTTERSRKAVEDLGALREVPGNKGLLRELSEAMEEVFLRTGKTAQESVVPVPT